MRKYSVLVLLLLGSAVVAACSSDKNALPACLNGGIGPGDPPGVLVQNPGLDVEVRDPFGRGQAIGTTAVVRRADGVLAHSNIEDTLNILSAYALEGTFSITLTRPYYTDATIAPVTVSSTSDGCVSMKKIPATLQLAPGAPALRSITILGADFLDHPGAQAHLVAHFDANPDVSAAVTWQVSDTTLATVDANGLVTAKCSKAGGTVKVSVSSAVDSSVGSSVNMSVAPATTCS